MRRNTMCVLAVSIVLCCVSASPVNAETPQEAILRSSDWSFVIEGNGTQTGGMRIRNGIIYPARLDNPVGEAGFAPSGELMLQFVNHPKISFGETLLTKEKGKWVGPLVQATGVRRLELTRKK